ncbi:MAG: hypothetical protein ISS78_07285 [Phycisphaerae bacterium]|nr:hypothetical protein [Phycisphaerae bacterium]
MTIGTFKGYVLVTVCGLVVVAVAVLLALQWGNSAQVTMYGPVKRVNTAALMLCSGVGGVLVMWVTELFLHGWRILRSRPRR